MDEYAKLTIYVPVKVRDALLAIAENEDRSLTRQVARMLEDMLEKRERSKRRRAKAEVQSE